AEEPAGAIDEVRIARHRIPLVEHADHRELGAPGAESLAYRVAFPEDGIALRRAQDRDALGPFVLRGGPALPVLERHLEHRKEIARGRDPLELDHGILAARRLHRARDFVQCGAARALP